MKQDTIDERKNGFHYSSLSALKKVLNTRAKKLGLSEEDMQVNPDGTLDFKKRDGSDEYLFGSEKNAKRLIKNQILYPIFIGRYYGFAFSE